jgi:hypothetical protein
MFWSNLQLCLDSSLYIILHYKMCTPRYNWNIVESGIKHHIQETKTIQNVLPGHHLSVYVNLHCVTKYFIFLDFFLFKIFTCPSDLRPFFSHYHFTHQWKAFDTFDFCESAFNFIFQFQLFSHIFKGSSWWYGSWIYNYLCNQCLSPLKLWVRTPFMTRCTRYNIMWWSLSVTCDRSVVFSGFSGFLHQ